MTDPSQIPRLLQAVADALNACDDAGLRVRLKHGAVWTAGGYVLPTGADQWVARSSVYTAFDVPIDDDDFDS